MYLGIDLGTGSVKVMLLDRAGGAVSASHIYPVLAPAPGRAETDPEEWLRALEQALTDLNSRARDRGTGSLKDVRAVGFSGQMHGVVPVKRGGDGTTEALHPAILWADGRGAAELERYHACPREMRGRLGNRPASGMAGTTLLWLHRNAPAVLERADAVLFPKDYVRAALTGDWCTDYSDASGSLLYDFRNREWYGELIETLELPATALPEIRDSVAPAGHVTAAAAARFGIPEGTPVAVGAGDTPAAMYGSRLTDEAVAQISVGTAAQAARPVAPGVLPPVSSVNLFEGAESRLRYQVAAMLNGGLALEWVRERLGFDWDGLYARLDGSVTDDPGEILFLPYLTGERTPHLNPDARGAWVGLSLHHDTDDLARAALLGVACTVRLGMETLEHDRAPADTVRLVGGSARYAAWRQMLSLVLERPLEYSEQTDGSARGAAYTAARLLGEELPAGPAFVHQDAPDAPWVHRYYERFLEVYGALHPPRM